MIAMICHEANRAYCAANGDESQPSWNEAPRSSSPENQGSLSLY